MRSRSGSGTPRWAPAGSAARRPIDRRAPGGTPRQGQVGRLLEDLALEQSQLVAGLDPLLLHQDPPDPAVRGQGLGLATTPVQGDHELGPEPLAVRVLGHQPLELGDDLGVAPQRQVGVDPQFERLESELVEPPALGGGEWLVGEIRQCLAPPQGEARPQRPVGRLGVLGVECRRGLPDEPLEAGRRPRSWDRRRGRTPARGGPGGPGRRPGGSTAAATRRSGASGGRTAGGASAQISSTIRSVETTVPTCMASRARTARWRRPPRASGVPSRHTSSGPSNRKSIVPIPTVPRRSERGRRPTLTSPPPCSPAPSRPPRFRVGGCLQQTCNRCGI